MVTKSRDGEFIGSGMRASFLKEKIDLAHCRGYAVLVIRATSADDPDDKAVYNMYQVNARKGQAVQDMYEALKVVLGYAESLRNNMLAELASPQEGTHTAEEYIRQMQNAYNSLAKAEGRNA